MRESPVQREDGDSEFRYVRLHPAWYCFIKHCEALKFGEIERLKIHQGLPVVAEEVKKKINFMRGE
ncbi:MAG: hypothetical protein OEW18_15205 [Candidatus Aminicenantes bacterium]|nr:hypothetical protein [Candidatus Aminicenantes bacterium]